MAARPQLLRGYTANQVICDESAFFKDDELVFFSVLYSMIATTDGVLIASSTPWSTDSVFYKMCNNPQFSKHFITCEDVVKAGLIKPEFIEEMKQQLPFERFQREFMAEFVEDVDAWLTQSLMRARKQVRELLGRDLTVDDLKDVVKTVVNQIRQGQAPFPQKFDYQSLIGVDFEQ